MMDQALQRVANELIYVEISELLKRRRLQFQWLSGLARPANGIQANLTTPSVAEETRMNPELAFDTPNAYIQTRPK